VIFSSINLYLFKMNCCTIAPPNQIAPSVSIGLVHCIAFGANPLGFGADQKAAIEGNFPEDIKPEREEGEGAEVLAAFLGTIPETLSRVFAKLSSEGVLEIEGARIRLLDLARLRALAGMSE
jgi:hypothetical protein